MLGRSLLQWGRVVIDAERRALARRVVLTMALQWGRVVIDAERGRPLRGAPARSSFNGAAS